MPVLTLYSPHSMPALLGYQAAQMVAGYQVSQMESLDAIMKLWRQFVHDVRGFWEVGEDLLPHVGEGPPDWNTCLLHQVWLWGAGRAGLGTRPSGEWDRRPPTRRPSGAMPSKMVSNIQLSPPPTSSAVERTYLGECTFCLSRRCIPDKVVVGGVCLTIISPVFEYPCLPCPFYFYGTCPTGIFG